MKKVLLVNSSLTAGGSERVMAQLANGFADKGIDTTMLLTSEIETEVYEINSNVRLIRFKYRTQNKVIRVVRRVKLLRELFKNEKYDTIISFLHKINLTVIISALGLKQHIIVSERNNPMARKHSAIWFKIENYFYAKVETVVFQTDTVRKMYAGQIQRIGVVIPNPVNETLPVSDFDQREKVIIAAGRFVQQKNFPLLLRAFSRLHISFPEFKLVLCGTGPLEGELKALCKELNIENAVEFTGFVSDLAARMNKSYLYVSSSDYEGISNAMLEAMAIGLPCICTDCPVGGAAMSIEDGHNGILIPVGDENALVNAFELVLTDEQFARHLSENALEIRKKYASNTIVDRWLELI